MHSNQKVCFIIPTVSAGGIETYLLRFLDYLGEEYEVTVLVRGSHDGELKEKYIERNITLIFMPLGYLNPRRSFQYYRFFKREEFDVVCDFNANFSGITMLTARLAGVKIRITFYRQGRDHFPPGIIRNWVNWLLNRLVYQYATKILFNSRAALGVFFPNRKKDDSRFDVIYNGIDPKQVQYNGTQQEARQKLGLPEDKFIIGHIGRKDPAKNHEVIFKTALKLIKSEKDIHFVLCGSGTKEFETEKNRYRLNGNITILGYRNDVPVVLRSLNIFFFPSITEGQPNALIEAMLQGVPVIASNILPIEECVPDNVKPYLKRPDDIDGFVRLIEQVKSEGYSQQVKNESIEWVYEKFNSGKNFKKFEKRLIK